jgi:hypothetical protein
MLNGDSLAVHMAPVPGDVTSLHFTSPKVRPMALTSQNSPTAGALERTPARDPFGRRARAYCGPAHGRSWIVDTEIELQSVVWLEGGAGSAAYQVTFDPMTSRPARDRLGNFVYMPVR